MMRLAVFDIDGTLVDSDHFDGPLYAEAIRTALGLAIDTTWGRYSNVTDSGILDQVLDESGLTGDREPIHTRVKTEFVRLTRNYVDRNPEALREIPGANVLIETLRKHASITVAIASGGWRETAELKLRGIGIDPDDLPMATASDSSDRCTIIRLAEQRAMNGGTATGRTYFGDGVWDKQAAAELNYEFVAVGRGVEHDVAVQDLSDHAAILALLTP